MVYTLHVHVHTSNVFNSYSTEFLCCIANGDQNLDQWAARIHANTATVFLPIVIEKLAVH